MLMLHHVRVLLTADSPLVAPTTAPAAQAPAPVTMVSTASTAAQSNVTSNMHYRSNK
jgi:hypothetical protein